LISTFGIRFNVWAVHLFTDNQLPKKFNEFAIVDQYFMGLRKEIEDIVINYPKMKARIYYI